VIERKASMKRTVWIGLLLTATFASFNVTAYRLPPLKNMEPTSDEGVIAHELSASGVEAMIQMDLMDIYAISNKKGLLSSQRCPALDDPVKKRALEKTYTRAFKKAMNVKGGPVNLPLNDWWAVSAVIREGDGNRYWEWVRKEGAKACPGLLDRYQQGFSFPPESAETGQATAIYGGLLHKEKKSPGGTPHRGD
jgi:hypothetical protein